ncbi:MAG: tRNA (adenosine(37)-N6)-threonylcarbamoyltransferase complex dimerization subunit type 1 TsaB [Alphaproteobacteria bacterium]|nr:tRNA (adenosine(37)-N6)-threonylcarbamoyltransferase complex dimerization subunit type 1 TsaB [Alphaproteobacteria bacterium]
MTTLAISTSSPALSIALVDGPKVLARHHDVIGRGHAEALVPRVAALLAGRRPDRILVDVGPGSYTGIRIGIAAARALGLAWGVPVHGLSALALVAAQAFASDPALACVWALIDAGRGQVAGARLGPDLLAGGHGLVAGPADDGVALAGAGAALWGRAALHGDHPDAAMAGRVPAAALLPPQALYAGD